MALAAPAAWNCVRCARSAEWLLPCLLTLSACSVYTPDMGSDSAYGNDDDDDDASAGTSTGSSGKSGGVGGKSGGSSAGTGSISMNGGTGSMNGGGTTGNVGGSGED